MNLKKTLSSLVSVLSLVSMVACEAPQKNLNSLSNDTNNSFHVLSKDLESSDNEKEIEKEAKKLNPEAISTDKEVIRELSKHKLNFNYKDKSLLGTWKKIIIQKFDICI